MEKVPFALSRVFFSENEIGGGSDKKYDSFGAGGGTRFRGTFEVASSGVQWNKNLQRDRTHDKPASSSALAIMRSEESFFGFVCPILTVSAILASANPVTQKTHIGANGPLDIFPLVEDDYRNSSRNGYENIALIFVPLEDFLFRYYFHRERARMPIIYDRFNDRCVLLCTESSAFFAVARMNKGWCGESQAWRTWAWICLKSARKCSEIILKCFPRWICSKVLERDEEFWKWVFL